MMRAALIAIHTLWPVLAHADEDYEKFRGMSDGERISWINGIFGSLLKSYSIGGQKRILAYTKTCAEEYADSVPIKFKEFTAVCITSARIEEENRD